MRSIWRVSGAIAMLAFGCAALAHHSFAMFDQSKQLPLKGTVHDFQWTNPHAFIDLMVDTPQGPQKFTIECPTPGVLRSDGWKCNSLKPGDKVVAKVRPLRSGKPGGGLNYIFKDGVMIGTGKASASYLGDRK